MSISAPTNGMMCEPLAWWRVVPLPLVDVVIGTEDEINAAMLSNVAQMSLTHSQVSDTKVEGDTRSGIEYMLTLGPEAVVEKIGPEGARIPPQGRRSH